MRNIGTVGGWRSTHKYESMYGGGTRLRRHVVKLCGKR